MRRVVRHEVAEVNLAAGGGGDDGGLLRHGCAATRLAAGSRKGKEIEAETGEGNLGFYLGLAGRWPKRNVKLVSIAGLGLPHETWKARLRRPIYLSD